MLTTLTPIHRLGLLELPTQSLSSRSIVGSQERDMKHPIQRRLESGTMRRRETRGPDLCRRFLSLGTRVEGCRDKLKTPDSTVIPSTQFTPSPRGQELERLSSQTLKWPSSKDE